jgi:hypothetical protein
MGEVITKTDFESIKSDAIHPVTVTKYRTTEIEGSECFVTMLIDSYSKIIATRIVTAESSIFVSYTGETS